jgi:schlafen family protein
MHSKEHLSRPATQKLGEFHWNILHSSKLMDSQRWQELKEEGKPFSRREFTDFGREVGLDEIHWWIFKKERNVAELGERAKVVLQSAERLKEAAESVAKYRPKSYEDLIRTLAQLADRYLADIEVLLQFVNWLRERDEMAPRILFTYRVWGSTRMSDRTINVPDELAKADTATRISCAELALGLSDRGLPTYEWVESEMVYERYEQMDPEQLSSGQEIEIPESLVVPRAARKIFGECAVYFREIRSSLQNILIDVDKFQEQEGVAHNDEFWRQFIRKAVATKKTETQLWEFKQTLPLWHVKQQPQRDDVKTSFAEDLASMANSDGGVLVVGVSDNPRIIVGLPQEARQLENDLKAARDAIDRHMEYDRELVKFQQVPIRTEEGEKLCLVLLVAQARSVVGVHDGSNNYTYPLRRENGMERVSGRDIEMRKAGLKADNFDFLHDIKEFVRGK